MTRYIRIKKGGQAVRSTVNHREVLEKHGYKVKEEGDFIAVECSGVVEGVVDFSSPEVAKKELNNLVASHKVYSYNTEFRFPSGKVLKGVFACRRLGKVSAFVTRGSVVDKVKSTNFLDEILG